MANPGDIVYEVVSSQVDLTRNRCDILVRFGVVDSEGAPNYRNRRVSIAIDNTNVDAMKAIVAALLVVNLPDFLTGAVPA